MLSVEASVKSRTSYGGTAPKNVLAQAKAWLKRLEKAAKIRLSARISLQFHDCPGLARTGQSLYGAARIGDFVVNQQLPPEPFGMGHHSLERGRARARGLRTQGPARPAAEHPAAGGRRGAGRCRPRAGRRGRACSIRPTEPTRADRPKGGKKSFILDPLLTATERCGGFDIRYSFSASPLANVKSRAAPEYILLVFLGF